MRAADGNSQVRSLPNGNLHNRSIFTAEKTTFPGVRIEAGHGDVGTWPVTSEAGEPGHDFLTANFGDGLTEWHMYAVQHDVEALGQESHQVVIPVTIQACPPGQMVRVPAKSDLT